MRLVFGIAANVLPLHEVADASGLIFPSQDKAFFVKYTPAEVTALQKTNLVAWAVDSGSFLDGVYDYWK